MKVHEFAVWGCLALAGKAGAQVVNDDCANATDLGMLQFEPTCAFNNANGEPAVYPFSDSTALAGPEFPYPAMPLTCDGYAPSVTVPSNDMWYKFYPGCWFSIEVEPGPSYLTDTVHMSLWFGPDCGQLVPLKCYTLAANTALNDSLIPLYSGPYYLQVSSPSLNAVSRFSLCLRAHCWPIDPAIFTDFEPTPVLCFPYELTLVHTPDAGGAGSAAITLDDAYGPYSIIWSDGTLDVVSRNDLPVGDHTVTITTNDGCTVLIPFTIVIDPNMTIDQRAEPTATLYYFDHELNIQFGSFDHLPVQLDVFDARGALVAEKRVLLAERIDLCNISAGVHVVRLRYADGNEQRYTFAALP